MSTKKAFQKPKIEEVEAFMQERKPEWPAAFCRFYAEKFWNSYEKSGWRLSAGRGGPVKSWKACFSSNWQDLTYQSDRDKLAEYIALDIQEAKAGAIRSGNNKNPVHPKDVNPEVLDTLLVAYTAHPTKVHQSQLAACYDWIKEKIKVKLSREQRDIVMGIAEIDQEKAKATVVKWVFEQVANGGKTFKQLFANVR